ncbi:MAG TPA: aromatic ring-hydroxylating dioxygenase subunit alpha [Candidatus Binatia bacterium]|nr:aromatic ring-hydroxylating dioxygenase subunit alpha [Candidatus Binatia bacterium]
MDTHMVERETGVNGHDVASARQPVRDFQTYIVDRPEEGMFTIDRALFSDPELFELEMKYIFEGTWVYLAHESQLPHPHDFYTTTIGRQPIILMRNQAGEIGGFLNACPHRGATVCLVKRGNQKVLTCPYHGWSFSTSGALVGVKDYVTGAYSEAFDRFDHGLAHVPRLASYRGFLFGSLNPAGEDLETHLGETRIFIDMIADQAPQGWEVVKGSTDYTYAGNWKLQVENGVDGYHFDVVHRTFLGVIQRRMALGKDAVRAVDAQRLGTPEIANGCYDLGHGHTLLWTDYPNPQDRPLYERRGEIAAHYGEAHARWMMDRVRNLLIYPNIFFMDQASTQLRVIHPLAVDKTRVSTYCIAPVGESAAARAHRLRQYEDFFNASGVGTPDDLAAFEACQRGYQGRLVRWQQGYMRGVRRMTLGADAEAQAISVRPYSSTNDFRDETIYHGQYRQWLKLMLHGQRAGREASNGA